MKGDEAQDSVPGVQLPGEWLNRPRQSSADDAARLTPQKVIDTSVAPL